MDEYRDHVIYRFPRRRRIVIQTRFWLWAAVAVLACIVVGLMFLSAARAQQKADPVQSLSSDWQAMASLQVHVQDDLNQMVQALREAQGAEERLKWVLDNWVPKSPTPQAEK